MPVSRLRKAWCGGALLRGALAVPVHPAQNRMLARMHRQIITR